MSDDTKRRQWMAMLAKLTAPMSAPVATKALVDMLPMLEDFPDAVFTLESLEHVASQCQRVPIYAELRQFLGEWWRTHRPPEPALPPPSGKRDVKAEDLAFWNDMSEAQMRDRIAWVEGFTGWRRDTLIRSTYAGLAEHAAHRLAWLPPHWLHEANKPEARDTRFAVPTAQPPQRSPDQQRDAVEPTRPKPSHFPREVLDQLRKKPVVPA